MVENKGLVAPAPTGNTPADMIRLAVTGGVDLEKLEKLLILQERYEGNEARKIFALSFAAAQEKIGSVIKTKINPQTQSKYADLSKIIESSKPIYTKEGFAVIFYEGETTVPESIRVCADILHQGGHKETYHFDMPLDGVGIKGNANMTKIHGKASSVAYARRYLMCMIWNIPTQDDDGNAAGKAVEYITEKQIHQICDFLAELNIPEDRVLKFSKVEKLEDITKTQFPKIIAGLQAKLKEKKGAK